MELKGAAGRPSTPGPEGWFTGEVWMEQLASLPSPGLVRMLLVHFSPGARTAWHAHPLGQVLHVVQGTGRVQAEGGQVRQLTAGDTVEAAPGERHWHGAAPGSLMSHIAVQEQDPETGDTAVWYEHVTEAGYRAAPAD